MSKKAKTKPDSLARSGLRAQLWAVLSFICCQAAGVVLKHAIEFILLWLRSRF